MQSLRYSAKRYKLLIKKRFYCKKKLNMFNTYRICLPNMFKSQTAQFQGLKDFSVLM